jgi:type 1 glutamine amidotransferase
MVFSNDYRFALPPMPVLVWILLCVLSASSQTKPKVLCFTRTQGFDHGTRTVSDSLIMALGAKNGFDVDTTDDTAGYFKDAKLKEYKAVCFVNVTGNIFNDSTKAAFQRYFTAGGGFVGMHACADCEYTWHWYHQMLGAYFAGHPFGIAPAKLAVLDHNSPSTQFIKTDTISRSDEWYFFDTQTYDTLIDPAKEKDLTVLMNLVESSLPNSKQSKYHPICWAHPFQGGRAWYSGFGHMPDYFRDTVVQKNLLGGILWAAGIGNSAVLQGNSAHHPALAPIAASAVYDAMGRRVRTLAERSSGGFDVWRMWDKKDDAGRAVCAGRYFLEVKREGMPQLVPVSVSSAR